MSAPDFSIHFGGSVSLFVPLTSAGEEWLAEHCSGSENQYLGRNLAVEHRYLENLIDLAVRDGLTPPGGLCAKMNTPNLHELGTACYSGACNPHGVINSLGNCINGAPPGQCRDSLDLKYILGHLSFLVGESLGPSSEVVERFKP